MTALGDARAAELARFAEHARRAFAAHPDLQSAALCVAQYWNDEAHDAVHHVLVWSRAAAPEWPHRCPAHDDPPPTETFCGRCLQAWSGPLGPLPWEPNGRAIRLFAEFCKPGCDQGMAVHEAFAPYALVTRGGAVRVVADGLPAARPAPPGDADAELQALLAEVYAAPGEDLPRRVLADWLIDHDDPRGDFIGRQLAGASVPARPACDRWWRGAPPSVPVEYRRGFPARVDLGWQRPALHPSWATVEHLVIDGDDAQWLVPQMAGLRRIEGLDELGLFALTGLDPRPPLEHVEVVLGDHDWSLLAALEPCALVSLTVRTRADAATAQRLVAGLPGRLRVREARVFGPAAAAVAEALATAVDADTWSLAPRVSGTAI